jgi:hypothetical protein
MSNLSDPSWQPHAGVRWPPQVLGDSHVALEESRLGKGREIRYAYILMSTILIAFSHSTFSHSTFCHLKFCHSTFCHSTFRHSTFCHSTKNVVQSIRGCGCRTSNISTFLLQQRRPTYFKSFYWAEINRRMHLLIQCDQIGRNLN